MARSEVKSFHIQGRPPAMLLSGIIATRTIESPRRRGYDVASHHHSGGHTPWEFCGRQALFPNQPMEARLRNLRSLAFATCAAVATFATLASAPSARGALINGTISGQVTSAGADVPGIVVGSLVTGSYTYDTSMTFSGILGPTNPFTEFSLAIGTNPYVFSLADLESGGVITPGQVPGNSAPPIDELFFVFNFTVLSNYVGGTVNEQTISNFPPQSLSVIANDPAQSFTFAFAGTSMAVPEPSTFTLLGLGCVTLAGCGRRLRRLERH
jgi:hypothetical protein